METLWDKPCPCGAWLRRKCVCDYVPGEEPPYFDVVDDDPSPYSGTYSEE